MNGITLGSLIAKAHLQLIVPLHFLLIVVVGLQGDATEHGIVALTTLVPVVAHIILQELQVVIPTKLPEVRFLDHNADRSSLSLHRFRSHLLHDVDVRLSWRIIRNRRPHEIESRLIALHQIGTVEIHVHQRLVEHDIQGITLRTRIQAKETMSRSMIESKRSEKLRIANIVGIQLQGVDTMTLNEQRILIILYPLL